MEPNELQAAWQALNERIERSDALNLQLLRERKLDKLQRSLRPLAIGQVLQIALGIGLCVLGIACWKHNLHLPAYFASGIVVHAFGVANIAFGAITLSLIGTLDPAAPLLKIQTRFGLLRRFYGFGGAALGLPWWILWVPVMLAFAGLLPKAPDVPTAWVWWNLGIGLAGLLATWAAFWWAQRHPQANALSRWLVDTAHAQSLRRAQRQLDELRAFEQA